MCKASRPLLRLLRPGLGPWLLGLLAAWCLWGPKAAWADTPGMLQVDQRPAIALWPAVTVLSDPQGQWRAETLAAQPERFTPPSGVNANLGRRSDTVWLRVPLYVEGIEAVQRVLDVDYPSLNRVDVHVLRNGRVAEQFRLGNELRVAERPMATRSHAATLTLMPGEQTLLLRVRTSSSMVLPMALRTDADMLQKESRVHLVQGLMFGLALCMVIYSLSHWVGLRDHTFLAYAVLVVSNIAFIGSYFGITGLYVWPDWPLLSMTVSPLAVLAAVASGATFMRSTLAIHEISLLIDRGMRGIRAAAVLGLVLGIAGLLPYAQAHLLATVLGLLVTLVVLPVAIVRTWRGEPVAGYMLFGWAFYILGAVVTAGLLRGHFAPSLFTQYCYPISTMAEMAAWMAVLGLRVQTIHRNADRARIESEALRAMAHTDPLTGLVNRRGLQDQLTLALQTAGSQAPVAVYLIDLDGFKPVNDRHGHDVGDALLVAVGKRLQAQLRHSDVVARLGGDEFVVLARGIEGDDVARAMGEKMLAAFRQPFDALGYRCTVGLTIGYALAPQDGVTSEVLLKRADEAMYAGKQAGRGRVLRAGAGDLPRNAAVA